MSETIIAVLIALIPSAAFGAVIQAIISHIRQKKEKKDLTKACFRMLFLDLLERMGADYVKQGYVTKNQYLVFDECYHIYHDEDKLNGNGYAKRVNDAVQALPIKEED